MRHQTWVRPLVVVLALALLVAAPVPRAAFPTWAPRETEKLVIRASTPPIPPKATPVLPSPAPRPPRKRGNVVRDVLLGIALICALCGTGMAISGKGQEQLAGLGLDSFSYRHLSLLSLRRFFAGRDAAQLPHRGL